MRAYQDIKLASKLFLSQMIIAALGIAIGILGISGMASLHEADSEMYKYNTLPMQYLATMYDTLASERVCANNMVIFHQADPQFAKEEEQSLLEKEAFFEEAFMAYKELLSNDEEQQLYDNINRMYYNDFGVVKQNVRAAFASGDEAAMAKAIYTMDSIGSDVSEYMDQAFELNDRLASGKVLENQALYETRRVTLFIAMGVGAIFAVWFSIYLGRVISRPLGRIKDATQQVAQTGNLHFSQEHRAAIEQDARYVDETGQLASAFLDMMGGLTEKTEILEAVASGDLTPDVRLASGEDTIGKALVTMLDNLGEMFAQIGGISGQVATSSEEIAAGSQSLSQGVSEQAATIEEISAAIAAIVSQSDVSAQTSGKAAQTGEAIRAIALDGNGKMRNMMDAVQEINAASKAIQAVIKAIDDIAFQTNILALNAAVEAARAGQHGKGFAVVADEVRNLAAKSAEAAKETSELITANIKKAELGLSISKDTAQSLQQIVDGIEETSTLLKTIADQTTSIRAATVEVDAAVGQVTQVVQQNSATSERSAAASEEMSSQAAILGGMIARFRLRDTIQAYLPSGNRTMPDPFPYQR